MIKKSKFLCLILATLLLSVFITGCAANSTNSTLVVGTNPNFPPFEYMDDNNQPDGFDMALIKEIGKRINMDVEIKSMEFKSLIAAIQSGQIKTVIAGMTVTEERKASVNFSDSYYTATQKVLIKKGDSSIKSAADLNGKKIGVQDGTTGDFIASGDEGFEVTVTGAEVSRYTKYADAVMDLINGRIDAIIIDANPAKTFLGLNENDIEMLIDPNNDMFGEEHYAIAVDKNDTELLKKINDAIKSIRDDGTYDKLIEKYIED